MARCDRCDGSLTRAISSRHLVVANMTFTVTKTDVEAHFATHGTGDITEIKLMNGFGFIEYKDAMDARDVVPGKCHPSAITMFIISPTPSNSLL